MEPLKQDELELFTFFEITPVLVCITNKEGFFRKVNPAVAEKLGYTMIELYASPVAQFIHPEDRDLTRRNRSNLLAGEALINFQNRYVHKNGQVIWLEWNSIYFSEKELVFAIARDITQRKQLEKSVEEDYKKFKSLASHFKSSIEKDRKFLAYELHEELAQLASALKMDLDMIPITVQALPDTAKTKIEHAAAVAGLLMKTIKRISFSISPSMLDEFGLNTSLEWLCSEFAILSGIPCKFNHNYNEQHLSHEVKTDFFRICQEALSNVMYHSKASAAAIFIEETGEYFVLSIHDNGIGFHPSDQQPHAGLVSMRERAASVNGKLEIAAGEDGKGTFVTVRIAKK